MRVSLDRASAVLKSGKVVSIATDTLYGLIAMDSSDGEQKIFSLKKRAASKPLIRLVPSISDIMTFANSFPPLFEDIARRFWPGPLTIILRVRDGSTMGFRIPKSEEVMKIMDNVGVLLSTSANLSGEPVLTSASDIEAIFGKDFPIVESLLLPSGIGSTIIKYDSKWRIIRDGTLKNNLLPFLR